jgi:RNA polymerase sigma factor (sigma-70 family)
LDCEEDIKDAVQEASLRVVRATRRTPKKGPYSFPNGCGFPAFVRMIAKGVAIDFRTRVQGTPEPHDPADGVLDRLCSVPDESEGVEELRECLGRLDECDQELIRLRYEEEFTIAELAEALGFADHIIVWRLKRAIGRLLAVMTARYPDLTALLLAERRSRD